MVRSASEFTAHYATRYPGAAEGGIVDGICAAADSQLESVQAGAVKGFSQVTGSLRWVKATENFFEAGETVFVGDMVEVKEHVAKMLVSQKRATFVSDEELAAATKGKKVPA